MKRTIVLSTPIALQSLVPGEVAKVREIHHGMKLLHQAQFTLLSNHTVQSKTQKVSSSTKPTYQQAMKDLFTAFLFPTKLYIALILDN